MKKKVKSENFSCHAINAFAARVSLELELMAVRSSTENWNQIL